MTEIPFIVGKQKLALRWLCDNKKLKIKYNNGVFTSQIEKSKFESKLLTIFTSQNKSGNRNQNRGAYTNLRTIPNEEVGNQNLILKTIHFTLIKFL